MTYYAEHAVELKRDLAAEIPTDERRELHRKRPLLHALIAIGNVLALIGSGIAIVHFDRWYLWLPFAFIAGFAVFDFTVLLHEVVHRAVLPESSDRAYRILGLLYAVPSGISASQFTKWHLDHHAGLGSDTDDPKRHYLFHVKPNGRAMRYGVGVGREGFAWNGTRNLVRSSSVLFSSFSSQSVCASASAGRPSVTRLIQRICVARSGSTSPPPPACRPRR